MWNCLVQTRNTEAFITGSNTATNAMCARIQSTEVNQLSTGRSCESRTTTAGVRKSISIAGPIVLAGRRCTGVNFFFTR